MSLRDENTEFTSQVTEFTVTHKGEEYEFEYVEPSPKDHIGWAEKYGDDNARANTAELLNLENTPFKGWGEADEDEKLDFLLDDLNASLFEKILGEVQRINGGGDDSLNPPRVNSSNKSSSATKTQNTQEDTQS